MSDTAKPTIEDLEIEVALTRSELAATADELAARLDPRRQAAELSDGAKKLVRDAKGTDPAADPAQRTRSRVVLAAGAAAVVLVAVLVVRRLRD